MQKKKIYQISEIDYHRFQSSYSSLPQRLMKTIQSATLCEQKCQPLSITYNFRKKRMLTNKLSP